TLASTLVAVMVSDGVLRRARAAARRAAEIE
ncbi:MAG: hypothetical protein QOF57_1160, partial [Frankiaceae bacterium]|nr:hypothetical protein [Frankiaceae bacterium]